MWQNTSCDSWYPPYTGCIFSDNPSCCAKYKRGLAVHSPQPGQWVKFVSTRCKKKQGSILLVYLLSSNPAHLSAITVVAQECCTSSKIPELCWGTSSSHGPWTSWGLEPTINSTQDSNSSILTFTSSKRKKIICSASEENHNKQLQLYRSEKELLPCCFNSFGASHTLKGCWHRVKSLASLQALNTGMKPCKAIFITPPPQIFSQII